MDLVGSFNPIETYWPNWAISPSRDENETYLKPPPRIDSSLLFDLLSSLGTSNRDKIDVMYAIL